jgi:hypothetical protein
MSQLNTPKIIVNPQTAKEFEEKKAKDAETIYLEEETKAAEGFKLWCETMNVIPNPVLQMNYSAAQGINITGSGVGFISKRRMQ